MLRKKYDTSVVFLYAMGKEKFLPAEFRKNIPYTTISSWRKIDYSKYTGHEFRYFFDEAFEKIELNYRYRRAKNLLFSFGRAWMQISPFLIPLIKRASDDKFMQRKIIKAIQYMQPQLGLSRTLRVFKLSRPKYRQWILEARFDCFDSFTSICSKHHPHQLELSEIKKMRNLLTGQEHDHWPIASIAAFALRNKSLTASLYSWYKYARLLGIAKRGIKKRPKKVGLVALYPNEYLHVDSTIYDLENGKRIYITFVMDNFSRMILGYHVADRLSFWVVKKALGKALKVIATHPDQTRPLINERLHSFLVSDGGRENNNRRIDKFLSELSGRKVTKIRALKDIRFSNSPSEAVNKIMKSRYLRRNKFTSVAQFNHYLAWAVRDYNYIRPHYKHKPRTPHEAYFNIPLTFDIRTRMKEGMKRRVQNNRNVKCLQCKSYRDNKKCAAECEF